MEADAVVTANRLPTSGALPPFFFPVKKFINTILLDVLQVLNHAHLVKSSVPFVELLKPMAGKVDTLVTKLYLSAIEYLAISPNVGALPGS